MKRAENLLYTKEHEWVDYDRENNVATIGITDFAQKELGDIVFVEIDTIDETLAKEEVFGSVEAVKTVSDLFMPMSGTISQVNEAIVDNPEFVNKDHYVTGWMIKVIPDTNDFVNELLNYDEYSNLIM
jgi:glycine cleavage system H protein